MIAMGPGSSNGPQKSSSLQRIDLTLDESVPYDGARELLRHIRPSWVAEDVQFTVRSAVTLHPACVHACLPQRVAISDNYRLLKINKVKL